MAAVTICSDFGGQENKVCHCFHCFPIYLPWSNGTRCMIRVFLMLNFKPAFSLSSFTFKRLFSSSSLFAIRVVSSVCLRLLIPSNIYCYFVCFFVFHLTYCEPLPCDKTLYNMTVKSRLLVYGMNVPLLISSPDWYLVWSSLLSIRDNA